jgi:hypothetical protein
MERNVNLRLRIILKALLAGAMRVARSCSRPVEVLGVCGDRRRVTYL